MSALRGFSLKQIFPYKGLGASASIVLNPGKVLPATATGNLFQVSGSVVATSLVGVVSTAFSATAVHPTIGVSTGAASSIAAAPASALASVPVGTILFPANPLGSALPVPPLTPAVPATTVPVTNNSSQAASVTISAGTITNVSVNGATVGAGAGTYVVPAGGTIAITYSVAPTWVWSQAQSVAPNIGEMELTNTTITITTDATNTGGITWLLTYVPLLRKAPGTVTAV